MPQPDSVGIFTRAMIGVFDSGFGGLTVLSALLGRLPDGGVMAAWGSYGQDGSLWGVYARKLTATGAGATAQEFLVNQYTTGNQREPSVCALANGNVVFAWVSEGERFVASRDVYARVFTAAGVPVTGEFLVSTATNRT